MKKGSSSVIKWGLLAILGLVLIFGHNAALNVVCKIVAVGLILVAAAGIYDWFKTKSRDRDAMTILLGSAAVGLVGIWMLCNTQLFIKLINVVIGLVVAVPSAVYLYRTYKGDRNMTTMIICAVGIVLGLVICFNNAATTWVVVAAGVGLLYVAITGFLAENKK